MSPIPVLSAQNMGPPTAKEIDPFDDLDGRVACEHFLGKTVEQAESLFRESPDYYQDDLMWMGPVAFRYYVRAAIRFLQDEAVGGQSLMIYGFASTLESRLEEEPIELAPIADQLAAICGYIVDHYDRIGDLPETEKERRELIDQLQTEFAKQELIVGEKIANHTPEDYIDLRPRFKALRQAFSDLARTNP